MLPCIIGWAHTPFGKLPEPDIEALIGQVAVAALDDAGVSADEIDAVFIGLFNNGFLKQDFPSSLAMHADEALRFKPAMRLENACASGSAAIYAGLDFIRARGRGRVLVIGAEKMTSVSNAQAGDVLLGASYRKEEANAAGSFVGVFAEITSAYFAAYGDQSDALAQIAAKNHRNGVSNPYAQIRKDLGFEFCRTVSESNPIVASPLKKTDCSPISDGAAALVLADADTAKSARRAISFRASAQANDFLPISRRNPTSFEGAAVAWKRALDDARLKLSDLSFVETHDCFTIAELIAYEAMGLVPAGQGASAIGNGWTEKGGRLPVNPSGGLKAKGHPIGATGVSMHVLASMQLAGEAGDMQIAGAETAGVFNMGGVAVANYVSVLERLR